MNEFVLVPKSFILSLAEAIYTRYEILTSLAEKKKMHVKPICSCELFNHRKESEGILVDIVQEDGVVKAITRAPKDQPVDPEPFKELFKNYEIPKAPTTEKEYIQQEMSGKVPNATSLPKEDWIELDEAEAKKKLAEARAAWAQRQMLPSQPMVVHYPLGDLIKLAERHMALMEKIADVIQNSDTQPIFSVGANNV